MWQGALLTERACYCLILHAQACHLQATLGSGREHKDAKVGHLVLHQKLGEQEAGRQDQNRKPFSPVAPPVEL